MAENGLPVADAIRYDVATVEQRALESLRRAVAGLERGNTITAVERTREALDTLRGLKKVEEMAEQVRERREVR